MYLIASRKSLHARYLAHENKKAPGLRPGLLLDFILCCSPYTIL
jgi:hypothetical protein